MAVTQFSVNNPLAMQAWAKKLMVEAVSTTDIAALIGEKHNNFIQEITDLKKQAGDRVTFGLRCKLGGTGVTEHETLEGNEEALSTMADNVIINELAHAARVRAIGTIDAQRVPFNLRDEATAALQDWYKERINMMVFLHLCGYSAKKMLMDGREILLTPKHWGFNEVLKPSSERVMRPNGKKEDESLKEGDEFNLTLIDQAVERAKTSNLRRVRVGSDDVFVLYLHPSQVTSLRTNTQSGQWLDIQKAAYSGSRGKNPIFDGSLGMYNGVILRESNFITEGVSSKGERVENVRRAVLLGAQAGMIAFGGAGGVTRAKLVEEFFDYRRELGIAAKTLIGFKKTSFSSTNGRFGNQDFATLCLPTYAKPV